MFRDEDGDVQRALMGVFDQSKTPQGDGALVIQAISAKETSVADDAVKALKGKADEKGNIPQAAKNILFRAIQGGNEAQITAAAGLARNLSLFDAIPFLIPAQVAGNNNQGGTRKGDLAYIAIGTQTAYVADLTPVVSESAVGFDPTLGLVNEGTLLRIRDAAVVTYRSTVNIVLNDLGGQLTGARPGLGYDMRQWKTWYDTQYVPAMAKRAEAK